MTLDPASPDGDAHLSDLLVFLTTVIMKQHVKGLREDSIALLGYIKEHLATREIGGASEVSRNPYGWPATASRKTNY